MFIVVEGPNGAGKTSLIKALAELGYKTLSSPNGTPLAKMLRPAARGAAPWEDIDPMVQFMLFSAARYDEYTRLVHESRDIVVADRWWTSTYVYQCKLQGIPVPFMEYTIHPNEKVDMVIMLDADDDILIERAVSERKNNPSHGNCRWTTENDSIKQMAALYRKELAPYLISRGINVEKVNTNGMNKEQVVDFVINKIKVLQEGVLV